jgi:tetratricopeptide (TPR) repeat protein
MKPVIKGLCSVFLLFGLLTPVQASENARYFLTGISAYQEEAFDAAITAFSAIADSGVENAALFYNLGNAYLKNDQLGPAVLWYERSLKLNPNDPDLKFNLDYALSLTKDQKNEMPLPLSRIFFFWKYHLNAEAIIWSAIILNLCFWLLLLSGHIWKSKSLQRTAYAALLLVVIFASTAIYNFYENVYRLHAIILPDEVSIRSGLSDDATELFVLHAGTKVRIEKAQDAHVRIYFDEGKIGWVKKELVGLI